MPVQGALERLGGYPPLLYIVDLLEDLGQQMELVMPNQQRLGVDVSDTAVVDQHCALPKSRGDFFATLLLAFEKSMVLCQLFLR